MNLISYPNLIVSPDGTLWNRRDREYEHISGIQIDPSNPFPGRMMLTRQGHIYDANYQQVMNIGIEPIREIIVHTPAANSYIIITEEDRGYILSFLNISGKFELIPIGMDIRWIIPGNNPVMISNKENVDSLILTYDAGTHRINSYPVNRDIDNILKNITRRWKNIIESDDRLYILFSPNGYEILLRSMSCPKNLTGLSKGLDRIVMTDDTGIIYINSLNEDNLFVSENTILSTLNEISPWKPILDNSTYEHYLINESNQIFNLKSEDSIEQLNIPSHIMNTRRFFRTKKAL